MRKLPLLAIALVSCGTSTPLQRVAADYESYGKVDDVLRRAPALCVAPSTSPHARKLYHLFAKDVAAYRQGGPQPIGQTLVKEAWEVVDGRKGPKQGLYVMMKTGEVDSDAGWIYGTLAPDGRVTSAGKPASCVDCHRKAEDRVFGLR